MEREMMKRNYLISKNLEKLNKENNENNNKEENNDNKKDFKKWNEFYDKKKDLIINEKKFRIYFTNEFENNDKVLLLLHGGGHTSLNWGLW
jgi:hypothetical protein